MENYQEVFKNYIDILNSKINDLFVFDKVLVEINEQKKTVLKTNCLKDKSHKCYYDEKTHIFSCPHCGYSANMIEILAEIKGISEVEALYKLLHIKLKISFKDLKDIKEFIDKEQEKMDVYYEINREALEIFKSNYLESKEAMKYAFDTRRFCESTVNDFEIGYANNTNSILNILGEKYPLDDLVTVGLIGKDTDSENYYEIFKNRLMFPIKDEEKRVIAFGGRTIIGAPKKYLNTKTTPLFKKSEVLYGLDKLVQDKAYKNLYICEGYIDTITMHQNGIKNVVATLGVALSKEHLKTLNRYTDKPILMLDGDNAGITAMERTIKNIGRVSTVFLEDKMDPDEFLQNHSKEEFLDYCQKETKSWEERIYGLISVSEGNFFENMAINKLF